MEKQKGPVKQDNMLRWETYNINKCLQQSMRRHTEKNKAH